MASQNNPSSQGSGFLEKLFCKHHYVEREKWHQQDRSALKIAYKCSHCGKIVRKAKR